MESVSKILCTRFMERLRNDENELLKMCKNRYIHTCLRPYMRPYMFWQVAYMDRPGNNPGNQWKVNEVFKKRAFNLFVYISLTF